MLVGRLYLEKRFSSGFVLRARLIANFEVVLVDGLWRGGL